MNSPAIAAVLGDRVRETAARVAAEAAALAERGPRQHVLREIADIEKALQELRAAGAYWTAHGAGIEAVAEDLGVSIATARRRYGTGAPDLPLHAVLAELDDLEPSEPAP